MIELRFPLRRGETLQRGGKFLQRFEGWVMTQIFECQPNVVGVMEILGSGSSRFELCYQFIARHVHFVSSLRSLTS